MECKLKYLLFTSEFNLLDVFRVFIYKEYEIPEQL